MRLWLLIVGVLWAARRPRWEPRPSVVADYNIAVEALNAYAFTPAEQVLRTVIEQDPVCGLCKQTLAIILVRQERPEEALQVLRALAVSHPSRPEVFSLTSIAAIAAGLPDEARATSARAVALEPGSFRAQRSQLSALLIAEDIPAATAAVEAALGALTEPEGACLSAELRLATLELEAVRPLLSSCERLGDEVLIGEMHLKLARAEGDLSAVLRLASEQRLEPLLNKAEAAKLLHAGELRGAMARLDAELTRRPNDPDALLLRAWCWQALEQPAQAEQDLVRLLAQPSTVYADEQGRLFGVHSWQALRRQAIALYVSLLVDRQDPAEARRRLEAERPTLGEGPALAAAEVTLLLAESEPEAATAAWEAAAERWSRSAPLAAAAIRLDGEVPLSASSIGWLHRSADPGYALQIATQRYHDSQYAACQAVLAPLLSHPNPETRRSALRLSHRCAVAAEDLPAARALLSALGASGGAPTAEAALRHAWLLGEAGADADALALLAQTRPPTGAAEVQHRSLSIWLLARTGDLDTAVDLLEAGEVEPAQRANLAIALYEAGQQSQGRRLMAEACDQMPEADAAGCRAALGRMR